MDGVRWRGLMQAFGFSANEDTHQALVAAYAEKHRHYHTAAHVATCLSLLDDCAAFADRPREIELALWFHDAIYKPLSGDNERRSAEWARGFLAANGAPREVAARVHGLILATMHAAPAQTPDETLLLDIDLAILGADAASYAVYEAAIRQEYRMVPMPLYRRKRAALLLGFLQRAAIYHNAWFRQQREQQARSNLALAVSRLQGG